MRKLALFVLAVSLAWLHVASNGADDIVNKAIQAAGGAKRLKAVHSRRFNW